MKKIFVLVVILSCQLMALEKTKPKRSPQQAGTGGIGTFSLERGFAFNDVYCKGQSTDKRPVSANFSCEISNGKMLNCYPEQKIWKDG